jgi:hypothetical protein
MTFELIVRRSLEPPRVVAGECARERSHATFEIVRLVLTQKGRRWALE